MKTLLEAGASSQAEMEQAETALATTEAQAKPPRRSCASSVWLSATTR